MQRSPFALFSAFPEVSVAIFDRADGIDDDGKITGLCGCPAHASAQQVHGTVTAVIRESVDRVGGADGILTGTADLLLTTRWGDCQNFAVYVPEKKTIGVLHAGWRGLAAGAIPQFFTTLHEEWGVAPSDAYIAAGPSLCFDCSDFTDPATELPAAWAPFIRGRCADLQRIADAQLHEAGVQANRFERHPDCTRCHPERYWTWRGGHKDEMRAGYRNILTITRKRA